VNHLPNLITDETLAAPDPTSASPQWWGADSTRTRMRNADTGDSVFIKTMTPAASTYIDIPGTFAAACAAGAVGIGPAVLSADSDRGELVMEDLTEGYSTASIRDFNDTALMESFVRNRRGMWDLEVPEVRRASVFDDIRSLHGKSMSAGVELPTDLPWMLSVLEDVEARITATGTDAVLIHGDSNASNLAVGLGTGKAKLLDYDWASYADPLQDIGSVLLELSINDHGSEEIFECYWGSFDLGLYSRAMCYRAADAVRGGLIGAWVDHCDPGTFEYSKFSDWMFLWARESLGDRKLDDYLEKLA
jgi:hypothetical protein